MCRRAFGNTKALPATVAQPQGMVVLALGLGVGVGAAAGVCVSASFTWVKTVAAAGSVEECASELNAAIEPAAMAKVKAALTIVVRAMLRMTIPVLSALDFG